MGWRVVGVVALLGVVSLFLLWSNLSADQVMREPSLPDANPVGHAKHNGDGHAMNGAGTGHDPPPPRQEDPYAVLERERPCPVCDKGCGDHFHNTTRPVPALQRLSVRRSRFTMEFECLVCACAPVVLTDLDSQPEYKKVLDAIRVSGLGGPPLELTPAFKPPEWGRIPRKGLYYKGDTSCTTPWCGNDDVRDTLLAALGTPDHMYNVTLARYLARYIHNTPLRTSLAEAPLYYHMGLTIADHNRLGPEGWLAMPDKVHTSGGHAGAFMITVGPAGSGMGLHFDNSDSRFLLAMLRGRKRIALVPPQHMPAVCPFRLEDNPGWAEHAPCLDVFHPHPRAPPPPYVTLVEIGRGEAVFVPDGWLHAVQVLPDETDPVWREEGLAVGFAYGIPFPRRGNHINE